MKAGIGFIETIEQEAKRIVDGNPTHSRAFHIGLRLLQMAEEEKGKMIEQDAASQTTNLNFWQAYQAMKRGEWVGNENLQEGTYLAIVTDGEGKEEIRHFMGYSLKVLVTTDMLNSTDWHIVPKSPRYKVGDRFELPKAPSMPDHILTILAVHNDEYAAQVTSERHGHIRFQSIQERTLDGFTKLPS